MQVVAGLLVGLPAVMASARTRRLNHGAGFPNPSGGEALALTLQSKVQRALGDHQQALTFALAAVNADRTSGTAWSALAHAQLALG